SKTLRRKARNTEPSLSQSHIVDGTTSMQTIYGSNPLNKGSNINKDLNGNNSLNVYSEPKDFLLVSDKSDSDAVMRKRISDLTATTENLRKDLKQMNSIVNDRLLPEVRSLTEGLQKHHTHLIALTQLVTCALPDGVQLLHDVTRGFTRHMPYEIPSKRMRYDDKPTVKTEQTSVPTVPSSRVPSAYNLFTSNSANPNNNLMNGNNSSPTLQTSSVTPSALTIPSDSQSTFNNTSIMGEFQQSPHNTQQNLAGFNESWNNATSVMITDPVNTVPSSNIPYTMFPTTTTSQSPILYSPSSNQQHSPPLSHHSQVPSRSSSIVTLSPEYVDNSANSNSNDMLNNAPTVTSPTHINASGANSPVNRGDVVVAPSPTS
ncbi:9302_t:CDS:2, partial [Funneliformis mosseae]